MDLKEADILGDSVGQHWYYQSKAAAVTRLLAGADFHTVLDIGAGSGYFSRELLGGSIAQKAVCVDPSYVSDSETRVSNKPIFFRRSIGNVDADLVLLLDVLEHVDDDTALLREYMGKVPEGTRFLISAPAFQCLWSVHDEFLEHKRRYTLRQLEQTAERAGLTVVDGCYFFASILPAVGSIRLLENLFRPPMREPRSQLRPHSKVVNKVLQIVCRTELALMQHNRTAGLTAFCTAEYRTKLSP
jgi:SAM-dependent methyltransferase